MEVAAVLKGLHIFYYTPIFPFVKRIFPCGPIYTASSNPCQVYSRLWIMAQVYPKASHSAQVR